MLDLFLSKNNIYFNISIERIVSPLFPPFVGNSFKMQSIGKFYLYREDCQVCKPWLALATTSITLP